MATHLGQRSTYQRLITGIFLALASSACVSVNLPTGSKGKSADVAFSAPSDGFEAFKSATADKAWKHKDSGATISYLSDCNDNPDGLENFERESAGAMKEGKVISSDDVEFNGRPARRSTVEGAIEGIKMRMSFIVFRKNSCDYILTHAARAATFTKTAGDFDKFLQGFRAP